MATLVYSAAVSVDGFIAGPGGDMSWLADYMGPNPVIDEYATQVGALLVGRRTFDGDDPCRGIPAEGEAFGGAWHGPQVVLTHHPPADPVPDVTFATDLASALAKVQSAAGDRFVSVLGANTAAQCLAAGVLDQILLTVVPVLLGGGVRAFESVPGPLEPISTDHTALVTNVRFRVQRR
jgi:dihydrofolate reductase